MKSALTLLALLVAVSAHANPVTLLTDSRYRHSDGLAQYNSTNSYLNGHQTIGWNMTAGTPFGSMDGYDLNEIPVGYYNGGSGTYLGGMVGMSSIFSDGLIGGSGFANNHLGIATSGPRAEAGDSGYARLAMKSHYEITFRVDQAVYFDLSGSLLGGCLLSLASTDGFNFQGSDTFSSSGLLNSGIYTILAEACSSLELDTEGVAKETKEFAFNLSYRAVPDGGASILLVGSGLMGALLLARNSKFRQRAAR